MAQTPNSSSAAYVTATRALEFVAPQLWADILRPTPEAPRPSYLAMIDPANPAGDRLLTYLKMGAGEIEAACAIAHRYDPDDLNALTGVSATLLQKLNTARALWTAYQYLKPGTARPEDCPAAKESADLLKALRDGEAIFSFLETQNAGLPSVNQAQPNQLLTPDVVTRARRLFPFSGMNRLDGGGE